MKECLYGKVYNVLINKMKHRANLKKKIHKKTCIHSNGILYIILHIYVNKHFTYLCTYMMLDKW